MCSLQMCWRGGGGGGGGVEGGGGGGGAGIHVLKLSEWETGT